MVASALSSSTVLGRRAPVIPGEPDLVDPVVERDDAVIRHHAAHVCHQPLWPDREAIVVVAFFDMRRQPLLHLSEVVEVPVALGDQRLLDAPDAVRDVAHHFDLGEVHRVDDGGAEVDVSHLHAVAAHEERRLLHHVVPDVDDQVGPGDRPVEEVVIRQCRVADEQLMRLVRNASRTRVGMLSLLTIWWVNLVMGRIMSTTSMIWNWPCLLALTGFWPVIITMGIAPSWA